MASTYSLKVEITLNASAPLLERVDRALSLLGGMTKEEVDLLTEDLVRKKDKLAEIARKP